MDSTQHEVAAAAHEPRRVSYVGEGLVVRSHEAARTEGLNGNRNYAGRFNINIEAMAEALEEQGRCDLQLLTR